MRIMRAVSLGLVILYTAGLLGVGSVYRFSGAGVGGGLVPPANIC